MNKLNWEDHKEREREELLKKERKEIHSNSKLPSEETQKDGRVPSKRFPAKSLNEKKSKKSITNPTEIQLK